MERVLEHLLRRALLHDLAGVHDEDVVGDAKRIEIRKGLASASVDPAEGCRFIGRCPLTVGVCSELTPQLVEARPGQSARCHVTAPSPVVREETHVEPIR